MAKRHEITKWRAKRRPKLTQVHANKRLAFANDPFWRDMKWGAPNNGQDDFREDVSRVKFSDECTVERGKGKKRA